MFDNLKRYHGICKSILKWKGFTQVRKDIYMRFVMKAVFPINTNVFICHAQNVSSIWCSSASQIDDTSTDLSKHTFKNMVIDLQGKPIVR